MNPVQEILRARNRQRDSLVAERTGIPRGRIEELLGGAEPNLEELRALSDFFRVDLRDLLPPHPRHGAFQVLFRTGGTDIDNVTSAALSRRIGYSVELLGDPRRGGRPEWFDKFRRQLPGYEEAEVNAEEFRSLFLGGDQLSPVFGLPEVASKALGALIFVLRSPHFEGASAYVEGLPFIFLAESFGPRMLFTLAHEIGHLIAHHDPDRSFAIVDVQTESRPQAHRDAIEFYAHAFASCLLMPREGVAVTLRKVRRMQESPNRELGDLELLLLAHIYGVSFYAAAKRCEDLQLLPRGGAASLNESLTKKYGSPEKRAEAANLPPRPVAEFPRMPAPLLKAALEKVRSGEMSVGKASSVLGLSIADLLTANAPRVN